MTAPALAATRFALALGVGVALGLIYGFLRPLGPRLNWLRDSIFVLCALFGWIYLGFGLCEGDLRFGYTAGMILGAFAWEMTVGRLLRPVFSCFWKFFAFLLVPFKKTICKMQKMGYNGMEYTPHFPAAQRIRRCCPWQNANIVWFSRKPVPW